MKLSNTKNRLLYLLLFILITWISSCTSTITSSKAPVFRLDDTTMQKDIAKLISCENINVYGTEINTNGKISSDLEISIVNGKSVPADQDQMIALAKTIAMYIKKALKDKNEYTEYKVLFVVQRDNNGVTTRNWTGKVFKTEEL